jgi:formylglycine-generating enzyme required for sulfatase activity
LLNGLLRLSTNPDVRPQRLVEYLSQRAGLLLPRGVQVYTFPHRTFQEYLAACYLTDHDFPDQVADLSRQDPNRWREVALLAGAKAVRGTGSAIWLLVEALCENDYALNNILPADIWGAHLAGQALAETGDLKQVNARNQKKLARVQDWLVQIIRMHDFAATERTQAGDTLARLRDTRKAATTLEHMEFCLVPAGPFHMGHKEEGDAEPHLNEKLHYDYWLALYPITVAQYAQFVEATQHKPKDPDFLKDPANRPVRFVTWHEAMKFCAWLTELWRAQKMLPQNWKVQLPSEAEWEKAARGGVQIPQAAITRSIADLSAPPSFSLIENEKPQRRYPWGEEADPNRANYHDTKIGNTSAVGCFPNGVSPYGCEEMSGNVWEWTRSLWGSKYPYDPRDGRENLQAGDDIRRVVRGGAFISLHRFVRCSCRVGSYPLFWDVNLGFRIALSP